MSAGPFAVGVLSDGRAVHGVRLAGDGMEAEVWDYGARLRSLTVPAAGGPLQVLPNPPDLAGFEADSAYHGCVIGRVANRIGGARFSQDGATVHLQPNERGNTLHGGFDGWSGKLWRFEAWDEVGCTLAYDSPGGEGGFPGAVRARAVFALAEGALTIRWEGWADAPTPLALTHHLYFNLSGEAGSTTQDHVLRIAAAGVTAVDAALIPTGETFAVAGGLLDLRQGRRLGDLDGASHPLLAPAGGLDLNYVLEAGGGRGEPVSLSCPHTGLALHIATDQPGCQVYAGQGLKPPMTRYGGVALEPQAIPDAVNHQGFPSVVVRPGEAYRREARYRFEAGRPRR